MEDASSRPAVTVYCASARGVDAAHLAAAAAFGRALAQSNFNLVYGGGGIGLMGELARSAQRHGAHVTGIITEQFLALEQGWTGCDELVVVGSMRERKQRMEDLGSAFAVLAGGLGTWEEFFETLVGRVIGRHAKPIGILNTNGFAVPLRQLIAHGVEQGFVRDAALDLLVVHDEPAGLVEQLARALAVTDPTPHDPQRMLPMHGPQEGRR
ncbi:MAG: TIGR00730 family Rossman fold protein [Planctomycetota bacterium]